MFHCYAFCLKGCPVSRQRQGWTQGAGAATVVGQRQTPVPLERKEHCGVARRPPLCTD